MRIVITASELARSSLPPKTAGIIEAPPAMVGEMVEWCTAYRKALELSEVRSRIEQETIPGLERQIGKSLDAGEKSRLEKMVESNRQKIRKMVDEIASVTGYPDDPRIGGNYEDHFAIYAKEHTFALDLSGWKYVDIVEKMKKYDLSRVKKAVSDYIVVNLLITSSGSRLAQWFDDGKQLHVDIAASTGISDIANMVEHELRHMAQCFLSAVLGSSAGLPSSKIRTPYIKQHHAKPYHDSEREKAAIDFKEMEGGDIARGDFHSLDDIEFYTDLGSAVRIFQKIVKENGARLSDAEWKSLVKMFVGLKLNPGELSAGIDPRWKDEFPNAIFRSFRKHRPKYVKAVNEFMKAARVIRDELREKAERPLGAGSGRRLLITASDLAGDMEFYHGTDSPPFDSFDPGKAAKGGRHYNPLGDAMYVTDKPEFAGNFGKNVYPVRIPSGARVRKISPASAESAVRDIVMRALKRVGIKWWDTGLQFKMDVTKFLGMAGHSPYDAVMEVVSYVGAEHPDLADGFAAAVSDVATGKFSKYDMVVFVGTHDPNDIFIGGTPTKEILIFNKEFQKVFRGVGVS